MVDPSIGQENASTGPVIPRATPARTAVNPTASSFITVWPAGEAKPLTSSLNVPPGDTRAVLVVVKVGAGERISVANDAGTVDIVADMAGFFRSGGANLTSLAPTRVWDTRSSGPLGRLGPGATRNVTIAGVGGLPPAGVSAVVLNVTAVTPSSPTFVTAWPAGEAKPLASNLNIPTGDTRANLVVVKVGAGGQVSFSNSAGSVDLVADVAGWYGPAVAAPPPPPLPPIADAPTTSATTYQMNPAHDGSPRAAWSCRLMVRRSGPTTSTDPAHTSRGSSTPSRWAAASSSRSGAP